MRSTLFLAAALALGVIASPLQKRDIVTATDVKVITVYVYVTAEPPQPTSETVSSSSSLYNYGNPVSSEQKPSSAPVSSSPTPEPASSSSTSSTPTPVAPSSTPESTSSAVPTPSPTPDAQPSSIVSSKAPISSAPASSASVYHADHPTGTIQQTLSTGADYQAAVLYHHNAARANHNANPLVWDSSCEANAMKAASFCNFTHWIPDGSNQGQNLFTVSGDDFNVTAGITEAWYKGEFAAMGPYWGATDIPWDVFEHVGHLTAVLWKSTTKVGCVSLDCGSKMEVGGHPSTMNKYTVCNYSPAGNIGGQYGANVGTPISTTNLGSWTD